MFIPNDLAVRILFIIAHADAEAGASATLFHLARTVRTAVHVLVMAHDAGPKRAAEAVEAFKTLLAPTGANATLSFGGFGDQKLFCNRFEVIKSIERQVAAFAPNLRLTHSPFDRHMDHVECAEATKVPARSFTGTILSFCSPSAEIGRWEPNLYNEITEEELRAKKRALEKHITQRGKVYLSREYLQTRARFFGFEVGVQFAEPFSLVRSVHPARVLHLSASRRRTHDTNALQPFSASSPFKSSGLSPSPPSCALSTTQPNREGM